MTASDIQVREFLASDEQEWDEFCTSGINSTFLHSRRFLNYHGNRFVDRSLLIFKKKKLVALMPAASMKEHPSVVVSHPGSSYGGIVNQGELFGERMLDAVEKVLSYYTQNGVKKLVYKATPKIYHSCPIDDDLFALSLFGAMRKRLDLSSTLQIDNQLSRGSRRQRGLKKSLKQGLIVKTLNSEGENFIFFLECFWKILTSTLAKKHRVKPVHSLAEIRTLFELFPKNISITVCFLDCEVIAGTIVFKSKSVDHSQYIASSEIGQKMSALDLVFDVCIHNAEQEGKKYFDFGISTEDNGKILNHGLYEFKSEFGCRGSLCEHLEIELS